MQWSQVRELFPNQWVLVEEIRSHQIGDKVCVDEVAVIRGIKDPREATNELFSAKDKRFVYHTSKEKIVIREIARPMIRRGVAYEN